MKINIFETSAQRVEREKYTIRVMVEMYCNKHHNSKRGELCPSCQAVYEYATFRIDKCVFGVEKPACTHCPVHCFRKDMKEEIKKIMRYSGPRMTYKYPYLAFMHLFDKIRGKRLSKHFALKFKRLQKVT